MTDDITDEIDALLQRVRRAKEILGMGGLDCAYQANKELEVVLFRLMELKDATQGENKCA